MKRKKPSMAVITLAVDNIKKSLQQIRFERKRRGRMGRNRRFICYALTDEVFSATTRGLT